MPNIFVFTTNVSDGPITYNLEELGRALREATATALGDTEPNNVSVLKIKLSGVNNMTSMQIFAVGNSTPERKKKLKTWAALLSRAWRAFAGQYNYEWVDNVGVWPTLVDGYWMMASEKEIQELIRII